MIGGVERFSPASSTAVCMYGVHITRRAVREMGVVGSRPAEQRRCGHPSKSSADAHTFAEGHRDFFAWVDYLLYTCRYAASLCILVCSESSPPLLIRDSHLRCSTAVCTLKVWCRQLNQQSKPAERYYHMYVVCSLTAPLSWCDTIEYKQVPLQASTKGRATACHSRLDYVHELRE